MFVLCCDGLGFYFVLIWFGFLFCAGMGQVSVFAGIGWVSVFGGGFCCCFFHDMKLYVC